MVSSSRRHIDCRFAALCGALLTFACATTQFDGQVFRNDELAFRVGSTPASWTPLETEAVLVAYRDRDAPATVFVNGRCGEDGDDVPLQSLMHHLFLQFTEREVISQAVQRLDGREALRVEMRAALDGVPKHFTAYVLKKDGCVYDFMHIAAPSAGASSRAAFDSFVSGFSTVTG